MLRIFNRLTSAVMGLLSIMLVIMAPATDHAVGAELELQINPFSGLTQIVSVGLPASLDFDGYAIASSNAELNPTTWNSLEDQAVPGWQEANPSNSTLAELNLTTSSLVATGGSLDLGPAYQGGPSGTKDVSFQYTLVTGEVLDGNVAYISDGLILQVDKFAGTTKIVNAESVGIDFDGYIVASPSAGLDAVAWNSLEDQAVPGWWEANPSNSTLAELNLTTSSLLAAGGSFELGDTYQGGIDGTEDLTFQYTLVGGAIFDGAVEYVTDGLRLQVDKFTGTTKIVNVQSVGIDFDSYVVASPSANLDAIAWNSLEDQAVTGWEEASPSNSALSELNLSASSLLAVGGSFDLGAAYQGGGGGTEDLTFQYSLVGGAVLTGVVEYANPGDFNVDGHVNGFDFLKWQRDLGDATSLAAWEANFGTTPPLSAASASAASVSATAVPEPTSIVLLAVALLGVVATSRNSRK